MNNEINEFKEMLYGYWNDKRELIKKHLYLNIFVYNEDYSIRRDVAIEGYYHDILMYDEDYYLRKNVANYTKDKFILEHLSNDNIEYVRNVAKKTLKELYNE